MTDIKKVKHLMSLEGKQSVIGSGSDSRALYSADYNLQEFISKNSSDIRVRKHILELFQVRFEKVKKTSKISIVDFKAGLNLKNNEALRWRYDDIMQGFKQIDYTIYKFVDTFTMVSAIKLESNGVIQVF